MMSRRRLLLLKTLLLVFIAALCLFKTADLPDLLFVDEPKGEAAPLAGKQSSPADAEPANSPAPDLSKYKFATLWGQETDPRFTAFSEWTTRYTNRTADLAQGIALAKERRIALKKLIRNNPKGALAHAV